MPPAPKDPSLRARRNRTSTRAVLTERKNVKIPPLPPGKDWFVQVSEWWRRAWSSPMVPEWTDSDIDGLYLVAKMMQQFWDPKTSPNTCKGLAGEIRQLLSVCGLTPMSRRSLQWEIDRGEAAAAATSARRSGSKTAVKKAAARPDPRAVRANLHAV